MGLNPANIGRTLTGLGRRLRLMVDRAVVRIVTDSLGRHHQLRNVSVHDGSLFTTRIGANPQLSVYGLTAKLATQLGKRLENP